MFLNRFFISWITFGTNKYAATISDHPFLMISANAVTDIIATTITQILTTYVNRRSCVCLTAVYTAIVYSSLMMVPEGKKSKLINR